MLFFYVPRVNIRKGVGGGRFEAVKQAKYHYGYILDSKSEEDAFELSAK